MKKITLYFVLCTLVLLSAGCGSRHSQVYYDMPSQVLSSTFEGTYVVRTQVRSKDAVTAFYDAQRKVVKEIIFDDIKAANNGVSDLKPLCLDMNAQENTRTTGMLSSATADPGNSSPTIANAVW